MAVGGGVTTEVHLRTSAFEEGVNKIIALVGSLNQSLQRIGEVAIGATLGAALTKIIGDLEKLPEAVISSASKMESTTAQMASAMEIAAKKSAEAWNKAGGDIDASMQKAQQGVDRSARDMAYSLEAASKKAEQFATQLERAGETAQRGLGANNIQFGRAMEDNAARGGQAVEDLGRTLSRAGEDYSRRSANIDAEVTQRISTITASYTDASAERARVFNQSMGNIDFAMEQSATKRTQTQSNLAEKFQDNIDNIQTQTMQRIAGINEAFGRSARAISGQIDAENDKFADGLELRQAAYVDATSKLELQHSDTMEGLADKSEKLMKDSAEATQKLASKVASAMASLREAEEKANAEFKRKMSDLAEEELIGPKTQEEQSALAKKKLRLQADLAQDQQAIDTKRKQVSEQAREERENIQKQTQEAIAELTKRQNKEQELFARRMDFLDAQYARESVKAEENHARVLSGLHARLKAEERARESATAKAEAAGKAAEEQAKKELARALRDLARQEQAEKEQVQHQRDNLRENYEAQQKLAAKQAARQIEEAKQNAERQREAARVQYERQVEDANRANDRIAEHLATQSRRATEDWNTAAENITRKLGETSEDIKTAAENSANQAAIEYEKLGDRFNENVKKMQEAIDKFNSSQSNKAAQVSAMFSDTWITAFNAVQEKAGRVTRLELIDPDDPKRFELQAKQMQDVAKEMSVAMGRDANTVMTSMAELALANLDPLQHNLLETVTTMAQLPGVTGGSAQVVRAFAAGATAQMGEMNQRFREFGVNLREVPGLVFNANGEIVENAEQTTKALADAMGTTTEAILRDIPDASQRVMQLVEITFSQRYKGVLERWLKTTEGQFAQAKAIFANFQLAIGQTFNEAMRGPLAEFVTFLKENQGTITEIAKAIGDEMARFATGMLAAIKRMGESDFVTAVQALIESLGRLKEVFAAVISGIITGLSGEGVDIGGAFAQGITNFAALIDKVRTELLKTDIGAVVKKITDSFGGDGGENVSKFEAAIGTLASSIGTAADFLLVNGPVIIETIANIINAATEIWKFVLEHGDQIKEFGVILLGIKIGHEVGATINALRGHIEALGKAFVKIQPLLRGFVSALVGIGSALKPVIGGGFALLGSAIHAVDLIIINFIATLGKIGPAIVALKPLLVPIVALATSIGTGLVIAGGAIAGFVAAVSAGIAALGPLVVTLIAVGAAISGAFLLKITTGIDLITPIFEALGSAVDAVVGKFKELTGIDLSPITEAIGNFFNTLGTLISQSWIVKIVQAFTGWFKIVFDKFVEFLHSLHGSGLIDDWFEDLIRAVPVWIGEFVNGFVVGIQTGISTVGNTFLQLFADIKSTIESGVTNAFTALQNVWGEYIAPAFQNIPENLMMILTEVTDTISVWAGTFGTVLTDGFGFLQNLWDQHIRPAIESIPANLLASLDAIKTVVVDWASNFGTSVQNGLAFLGLLWDQYLRPAIENLPLNIGVPLLAVIDAVTTWTTNFQAAFQTGLGFIATIWETFIQPGLGSIASGLSNIFNEITNTVTGWGANFQQAITDGLAFIKNLWEFVFKDGIEGIPANLQIALDTIMTVVVGWVPDFERTITDGLKFLENLWEAFFQPGLEIIPTSIESIFNDVLGKVETWTTDFQNLINTGLDFIKNIWEYIFKDGFESIPANLTTIFTTITDLVKDWANELLETLKTSISADKITGILTSAFSGVKDTVMGFLHQLHGSGELEPWLDDFHNTLIEGTESTVAEFAEAFTGIAEVVGDEFSAASQEVTLFVSSLGESANIVKKDMNNIIAAAKSGAAGIDRSISSKLAFGDTGPGGGGGGGGGGGFSDADKDAMWKDMIGGTGGFKASELAANPYLNAGSGGKAADRDDRAELDRLNRLMGGGAYGDQPSAEMQAANKRVAEAGKGLADAGKAFEEMSRESNAMQRENFDNLVKGISGGTAAWSQAAKDTSSSAAAWSGASQDVSSAVNQMSTAGGGQPTVAGGGGGATGPTTAVDFAVNVNSINIENGDSVDFMQAYTDQYDSLFSAGATL